jgi:hypothetical protein
LDFHGDFASDEIVPQRFKDLKSRTEDREVKDLALTPSGFRIVLE